MSSKKIFVFDTSTFLDNSKSLFDFGTSDIVIPLKVLEEIDNHKKRQDSVGANARDIIRTLDALREKGSLAKGVRIQKGLGIVRVIPYDSKFDYLLGTLDSKIPDNEIIGTAAMVGRQNPDNKVILVTRDINLRVKCDSLNIECQDYVKDKVIKSSSDLYSGYDSLVIDDLTVSEGYQKEIELDDEQTKSFLPNQFIRLVSETDEKRSVVMKWDSREKKLKRLNEYPGGVYGKLKPRSKEQQMALNLLLDPAIQVVTLTGPAGCGKTLLALAAALELVEAELGKENPKYRKVIVSRPVIPLGKDIGFLPGSLEEKMDPWLSPIYDNLEFLINSKGTGKQKSKTLEYYFDTGIIEVEAMSYIRGRSISNAILIFDEMQQVNQHEMKTIVTRVGENTKVFFSGDTAQIDNPYVNETTNGLTYLVEKFKHLDLAGHLSLQKGERSAVATAGANLL